MKLLPTTILVFAALVFQIEQSFSAEKNNNNSNSSVGTKELLARIEALESRIANLLSPDVAGASFRTTYLGNSALLLNGGVEQFLRFSTAYRELNFNEDGTATWFLIDETCRSSSLRMGPEISTFQLDAACATPPMQMTYIQNGSNIDLFRASGDYYSTMTISNDGSVLMMSGTVGIGSVGEEVGGFQFLTIGLRTNN